MRPLIAPLALAAALLAPVPPAQAVIAAQSAAPDFTLKTAAGGNLRLQEQRGQVVLLNFWATWCGPCKQEMPHLNRLYGKYQASGFTLLGVNVDDDPSQAVAAAARLGLKFPVLLDADKSVIKRYDMGSMPATVLIDRDGRVRYLHRGYREGMEDAYEKQIRELVKE
ncbi:MAG: TlpA family protein disulfide reductase [Betaproteobacteria bacterium]|nr:TlpA family protein disulfide reductase [Betaproteobacteria bacterium]